jgi:rubrerythrin
MGIKFNADSIFAIAEKIEQNGARFYRNAAEKADLFDAAEILRGLATDEESHEKFFANLRKEMGNIETLDFDPDGKLAEYLSVMADGSVFDINTDPSDMLTGSESAKDLFKMAIGLEKDSVVFYAGMRDLVPEKYGKDKLDGIIREEGRHILKLTNALKSLG